MSETETGSVAPEVIEAATPEVEQVKTTPTEISTETETGEEKQAPVEEKTFTQKELDEILQKRLAKSEARAERRAKEAYREALEAVTRTQPVQAKESNEPTRDQFASDADWIDAKVEYKLQQREAAAKQETQKQAQQTLTSKTEALYAQAEKIAGFDRESFDELPLTRQLAAALIDSDVAPQLMAYMSSNPEEVERISKLSDARQAVELGKLEVKLHASPKTSKAAPPIEPVGAKGKQSPNPSEMSMAEYKAYRQKQGARWAR
jgi:signal recognition particle GTPase